MMSNTEIDKMISYLANSNISTSKFNTLKDLLLEKKGCDSCADKPQEGQNFPNQCGECSFFYASQWEKR